MVWAALNKDEMPKHKKEHISFSAKIKALRMLLPIVGLIVFVLGSIYAGFTTPTEAAAFQESWRNGSAACRSLLSNCLSA